MTLGSRIGVISDVHGEHRLLADVLEHCRINHVESIVLLGDLFDRVDQAATCVRCLAGWRVAGVIGNHEREALEHYRADHPEFDTETRRLLENLGERFRFESALFVHDEFGWRAKPHDASRSNGHGRAWITFAGHTHYRAARDDNGPLDVSTQQIVLRENRRYLINPGAVVEGQFAVWDRKRSLVEFQRV